MTKRSAFIVLMIFSICWLSFSMMMLMGSVLGDCFDEADHACWAAKEWAPALDLWRGLAIQFLAITLYLLFTRKQAS